MATHTHTSTWSHMRLNLSEDVNLLKTCIVFPSQPCTNKTQLGNVRIKELVEKDVERSRAPTPDIYDKKLNNLQEDGGDAVCPPCKGSHIIFVCWQLSWLALDSYLDGPSTESR